MRRQEATEDGERENLPSWMFFFLIWLILGNKWRETDDRQAVRNELRFSLLSCCTFSLLAPCTFDKLILLCMNEHNVRVCRAFSEYAGACGRMWSRGLVWIPPLCLAGMLHQRSSAVRPHSSPHPMSVLRLLSIPHLHFLLPRCLHRMLCDERPIKWKKRILTWK